jgi:V8-like Glu-specific endopeptidase
VCGGGDESRDAVCYRTTDPVPYRRTKAVARMLIKGTELCTGFRVGPFNRMLTNNHCVATTDEAADTEVWFNYQCAECDGYAVFRPTKVWLNQVVASDKTLDYTVFSVTNFDEVVKYGYLELDVRRPPVGEKLYVPQHPGGEPTRIAMTNCAVDNNAYEGYATDTDLSYHCDTAGGSSGSPVLSRETDKVVALHHFGGCPNSGVRIERIYQQIQGLI